MANGMADREWQTFIAGLTNGNAQNNGSGHSPTSASNAYNANSQMYLPHSFAQDGGLLAAPMYPFVGAPANYEEVVPTSPTEAATPSDRTTFRQELYELELQVEKQQKDVEKQQRDAEELRRENLQLRKLINDNINKLRADLQPWMNGITASVRNMDDVVFGPQDYRVPLGSDQR